MDSENTPQADEADQRRDDLLRRALATHPISNEAIIAHSKSKRLAQK